jgi:hypothetical protein
MATNRIQRKIANLKKEIDNRKDQLAQSTIPAKQSRLSIEILTRSDMIAGLEEAETIANLAQELIACVDNMPARGYSTATSEELQKASAALYKVLEIEMDKSDLAAIDIILKPDAMGGMNTLEIQGQEYKLGDVLEALEALENADGFGSVAILDDPQLAKMLERLNVACRLVKGSYRRAANYDAFEKKIEALFKA